MTPKKQKDLLSENKVSGIPRPLGETRKKMIEEQKKSLNEPTEKSVEVEIVKE